MGGLCIFEASSFHILELHFFSGIRTKNLLFIKRKLSFSCVCDTEPRALKNPNTARVDNATFQYHLIKIVILQAAKISKDKRRMEGEGISIRMRSNRIKKNAI